jgi:hypothetical protein
VYAQRLIAQVRKRIMIKLLEASLNSVSANDNRVEWFSSARDISEQLWRESWPAKTEAAWWYQLLEDSGLEDQFAFHYGVIYLAGKAVGIVPAFIMDVPLELVMPPLVVTLMSALKPLFPKVGFQRTLFIGSPCADEGSLGLVHGVQLHQVAHCVQSAAESLAKRAGAPMLVWKDFAGETLSQLQFVAQTKKLFPMVSYPGTVVALPAGDFPEYLQSLSSSHRHNLNKKLKRSKKIADLTCSVVQSPDEATLVEIFGLFTQTYEKATTKFERLDLQFFRNAAQLREAHFVILREKTNNQMVAFMLCFDVGSKMIINKFIGIDYDRPKDWFLYFRLWEAAVSFAMSRGATQLQSGQTGYRPKIDVGHRLIALFNLCKHENPLVHALYAAISQSITADSLDNDLAVFFKAHPAQSIVVPEPLSNAKQR